MRRVEFCVVGDDVASGALAAACAASGTTAWVRGFDSEPGLAFKDFTFPIFPPVSFCAGGRDGFRPARVELRVDTPDASPRRRQWAVGRDCLALFRDLEVEYPGCGASLVDLYRRIHRPPLAFTPGAAVAALPSFLHPFGEGLSMFFGHLPLAAAPFTALAYSLRRMGPATYSPRTLLHEAEQAVIAAGGLLLSGAQVNAVSRGGRFIEPVNDEPVAANRTFLGNSEYLWRLLGPQSSDLFPFLGYGVLKKAKVGGELLVHWRDAGRPPVERNFAFCAVLPWIKGEAPYAEKRVIFGVNSSAYYWRRNAEQKSAAYRSFLEGWVAENVGDVKHLGWLSPPEVAVHPLRFTVAIGSFLGAEPTLDTWLTWKRALPSGVRCLLHPGFFTGEIAGWLDAADANARRLAPPKPREADVETPRPAGASLTAIEATAGEPPASPPAPAAPPETAAPAPAPSPGGPHD